MGLVGGAVFGTHGVGHVAFPESGVVAGLIELEQLQCAAAALSQFAEFFQPRAQLGEQQLVLAVALHHLWYAGNLVKLAFQRVVLCLGVVANAECVGLPRLDTAVAGLCVARVDGEGTVSVGCLGGEFHQTTLPVVDGVVVGNVPVVVGHTIESQFRSLAVLHRVAEHTAEVLVGQLGVETIRGTLHDDVAGIVCHREVPPIVGRTLDAGVNKVERRLGQVAAYHLAGPEHVDFRVQRVAVDGQATRRFGVGPEL